jgi:hypothetical protein
MNNITDILHIVEQVLVIIIIPLVAALIPTIKNHIETMIGKNNYEYAKSFISAVVHFVEQTHPGLSGDKKYIVAANAINDKFGDKLTTKEVDQLIESAIKQMNISMAANKSTTSDAKTLQGPTV